MSLTPPIATPPASSVRGWNFQRRARWWSRLVLLLVLWATAVSAASQLEKLTGPIQYSLCGPWGCTGPTSALVAYHCVWLMVLVPPAFVAGWALPVTDARRWAGRLIGAGLSSSLILFAWGSIGWLLRARETNSAYWFRRGVFVLVDESDVPALQILLAGIACLAAAHRRRRFVPSGINDEMSGNAEQPAHGDQNIRAE